MLPEDVEPKTAELFWGKVVKGEGEGACWLWVRSVNGNGYGQLSARRLSPYPILAHRFSFYLHHHRWPEPECLHSCDTPACVNPAHLREGTQAENMEDRKARRPRWGRRNPASKHAHLVEPIRAAVAAGERQVDIANRLGLTQGVVSRIARGVNYPEGR